VLRQIPALVASLFYRLGFHLDTSATIDFIGADEATKRRFLAMIISSGLAVCLSFTVLAGYLRKKLATDGIINSLALFGIFAGWFYFPSVVIAPVTTGWGWLVSALFAIAFVERNAAITAVACAVALFARETTMIFALVMFLALLLSGEQRSRGVIGSIIMLAASCVLYLVLRVASPQVIHTRSTPTILLPSSHRSVSLLIFSSRWSWHRACWCCSSFSSR
jgi:hypothetical protein